MLLSQDMRGLVEIFERRNVEYVVVGGYAVNYHGYSRSTQDFDLLLFPSAENATRIMDALEEFGFGEAGIPKEYFERAGSAIHLGVEPNRIDLLTRLEGVSNEQIFANATRGALLSLTMNLISLTDLIEVKQRSSRPRDLADAAELEEIALKRRPR